MPIYTHVCLDERCRAYNVRVDHLRPMAEVDCIPKCRLCSGPTELVYTIPTVHVWDAERRFPNLSPHGDGTRPFDSKADYDAYLTENNVGELSTSAPKKRKLGHKRVM